MVIEATNARKKILIVEDDLALLDIYTTMIQKAGFEIDAVKSGHEAIEKITETMLGDKQAPALILLDLILPDMDGLEVLRAIRKNEATEHIKVFIMTNRQEEANAKSDIKADKFIIKANVTPSELINLIKKELS